MLSRSARDGCFFFDFWSSSEVDEKRTRVADLQERYNAASTSSRSSKVTGKARICFNRGLARRHWGSTCAARRGRETAHEARGLSGGRIDAIDATLHNTEARTCPSNNAFATNRPQLR